MPTGGTGIGVPSDSHSRMALLASACQLTAEPAVCCPTGEHRGSYISKRYIVYVMLLTKQASFLSSAVVWYDARIKITLCLADKDEEFSLIRPQTSRPDDDL